MPEITSSRGSLDGLLGLKETVGQAEVEAKHEKIKAAFEGLFNEPGWKGWLLRYDRVQDLEQSGTSQFTAALFIEPPAQEDLYTQEKKLEMLKAMPNIDAVKIINGQLGNQIEVEVKGLFKIGNSKQ